MRRWTKLILFLAAILIPISLLWFVARPWPKPEITLLGVMDRDGEEVARFRVLNPHNVSYEYRAFNDGRPWMHLKTLSGGKWSILNEGRPRGEGQTFGERSNVLAPFSEFEFEVPRRYIPSFSFQAGVFFMPKTAPDPPPGTTNIERYDRPLWKTFLAKLRGSDEPTWSPSATFTKERVLNKP